MNRNLGISILIVCFGLSSINLGWADGAMQVPPVAAAPEDLGDINMQMIEQDRINHDQELAITGLIDDDQKLAAADLAQNQDATLVKINQTLIDYRNSILSRDHARVVTDAQRASKYYDLITLTEDVDDMRSARQTLQLRWDVIYGKHQVLTELQDELMALNEKLEQQAVIRENLGQQSSQENLEGQPSHENPNVIIDQAQGTKIPMLTQKLGEMDQKISSYDEIIAQKDQQIAQLTGNLTRVQSQVDLLKSELENKIAQENPQVPNDSSNKDRLIKQEQDQIDLLKSEIENKIAQENNQGPKDAIIKNQEEQIAQVSEKLKEQADGYAEEKDRVTALRDQIQQQITDEKAKDESIRWLNQVLAVAKNKANYYQLISQQDQMSMTQVRGEVQRVKEDFAERFKDYDQFENAIVALKSQVSQLNWQLSKAKDQSQDDARLQQGLKAQVQDREGQIAKMKADILELVQQKANKDMDLQNTNAKWDDHIRLAKQLIDLQQQEASLLEEKSELEAEQNTNFENRFSVFENKINGLLADRQFQTVDLKNRVEELKNELDQKQESANRLETELNSKIAEIKNQDLLAGQIQGLKDQLKDKDDQIAATSSQSGQMTAMMGDYQKKLEAKGNDYNEELKQVLAARGVQAQLQAQIIGLNVQLQEKESEIVNLKKDMYDLKELNNARDKDAQADELDLSIVQQKMVEKKIDEYQAQINTMKAANTRQVKEISKLNTDLAMVRQKLLERMPNIDEVDFLRTGYKNATMQLKQKDALILKIKANAQEYEREFKAQSREFQSLKDQLQDAQDELGRRVEDLKYKNMEIIRLKSRTKMNRSELSKDELQAQLVDAKAEIKDLHKQLDGFILHGKNDPLEEKLQQALDKIDQQGRVINALVQKLQDAGKSVDLSKL